MASISDLPDDDTYRLSIKREGGELTAPHDDEFLIRCAIAKPNAGEDGCGGNDGVVLEL